MDKHYNEIYQILVTDENDLAGAIAYSLYKQHKVEWLEKIRQQNNGNEPTPEQLAQFHQLSLLPSSIEHYQLKANKIVGDFLSFSLENAIEQLNENTNQKIQEQLKQTLQPIQTQLQSLEYEVAKSKSWQQLAFEAVVSVIGTIVVIILVGFLLQGYRWISSFNFAP
ncbi:hypothetical protein [Faucicola boevrei]|uniref:hypothetical protein n=1 Tax=Faucicola boevrei TaxID=346665 RepID=UPI000366FBCC|nr:hypothetical protein [Moraxella boevrei]